MARHRCVTCGDRLEPPARPAFSYANAYTFPGTTYAGHPVVANQGGSAGTRYAAHLADDGKAIRLTRLPDRFQAKDGHPGAYEHQGELAAAMARRPRLLTDAEAAHLADLLDVDADENTPQGVDADDLRIRLGGS